MSWDVSVVRFSKPHVSVSEIPDEEKPLPLGALSSVHAAVADVFPGVDFSDPTWGTWDCDAGSIEFNTGEDDPVEDMMLHVRASEDVIAGIVELCRRNDWRAIDCTDGEFLDDTDPAKGLTAWRAFRDRVLTGG